MKRCSEFTEELQMVAGAKTRTLSIRLLRKGHTSATAFGQGFGPDTGRALRRFDWTGVEGAELFIGQIFSKSPSWISFLQEQSEALPGNLTASGAGAVLFLPIKKQTVALCFGHAHMSLNDDAFERQFGLKVTLNAVPRDGLRTLDLATPDAVTFQKRVQASKDSDVQAFGVDMLRDLARVAGGTPTDLQFAKFVAGKDSLSITCNVDSADLLDKCKEVLGVYAAKTYQKQFAWVDNMRVVNEKSILEELDNQLFKALTELRGGADNELHMAPPEIVSYEEGSLLHYNGFGSSGTHFHSLSIEDYVSELNRCGFKDGITEIKEKHHIRAKSSSSEEFSERWKVYKCFTFETTLGADANQQSYVLFAGDWYCIDKQFKKMVEAHYDAIPKVQIVGATTCRNERELIADLVANRPDLLMLDQVKINPKGVRYANIEPCDFFSTTKQFIHLKDGQSSGPISHLWAQGVVSAEALVSDPDFRSKLRKIVKDKGGGFEAFLPMANSKVVREDYTVVYGIMRKPYADGSFDLPFFSKVSLQAATERIAQLNIPVALEVIPKPAGENADGDYEDEV
jgi:uncharacterized protein (TIGR04141 family)